MPKVGVAGSICAMLCVGKEDSVCVAMRISTSVHWCSLMFIDVFIWVHLRAVKFSVWVFTCLIWWPDGQLCEKTVKNSEEILLNSSKSLKSWTENMKRHVAICSICRITYNAYGPEGPHNISPSCSWGQSCGAPWWQGTFQTGRVKHRREWFYTDQTTNERIKAKSSEALDWQHESKIVKLTCW